MNIAPEKESQSGFSFILADLPHIPRGMPVSAARCITAYCGASVICRPAHGSPVLPFVPSANNCRSEHIQRMLLSDVAVTAGQHQQILWLRFGEEIYTKYFAFFFFTEAKNISKF